MAAPESFVTIAGSERRQPDEAQLLGPADPAQVMQATVMVRHKAPEDGKPLHEFVAEIASTHPADREALTHADFSRRYGAHPDDLAKVEQFAEAHGLHVVESSPSRRSVRLSGTVEAFSQAFRVDFSSYRLGEETYRGRTGAISVPAELGPIVTGVFGLDARRRFRPMIASAPRPLPVAGVQPLVAGDSPPFSPERVAELYSFPTHLDGEGQAIGIIELGGGFFDQDLEKYTGHVLGRSAPSIAIVHVNGAQNAPNLNGDPVEFAAYSENLLDIQVVAAVAPKAKIVVYFAPNTDLLDALSKALDDTVNQPKVLSISWGGPEDPSNQMFYDNFEQVLLKAASLGVTVCVSSGDQGSASGVNHSASSPNVLACGGTTLSSVVNGKIVDETAWPGSGGGVSVIFPTTPPFQAVLGVEVSTGRSGRGVPDVSGNADPNTGFDIVSAAVDLQMSGGTSAVAPLWAALIARFNQDLASKSPGKSWGLITPLLYSFADGSPANSPYRDIVSGSNGGFSAGPGWDAVTGLGSPNSSRLLELLQSVPSAEDAQ